jgi:hypothetical protein
MRFVTMDDADFGAPPPPPPPRRNLKSENIILDAAAHHGLRLLPSRQRAIVSADHVRFLDA